MNPEPKAEPNPDADHDHGGAPHFLPQDKAAQVEEVQSLGKLVAVTGDGVNDARVNLDAGVNNTRALQAR